MKAEQLASIRNSLRNDPKYELLCNKIKREEILHGNNIGETFIPQLISLPNFSKYFSLYPKGFHGDDAYDKFLLTQCNM